MMKRIYLDYAATTPMDPSVITAMEPYWRDRFGNPSSAHAFGQEGQAAVEHARSCLATLLHADASEIVFTGSGTESDNTAIFGVCRSPKRNGNHIITTAIEHHAVLRCFEHLATQGFEVTYLPVGSDGIVDPADVKKSLKKKTALISVMHANNEIGTIQPIQEIGAIARERKVLFHTDAVQTFGHLPIDVEVMSIDFLSLSAHKCYGPKGVGALFVRKDTPFVPLLFGGGHERGRRSSTLNVPGIVGLGKAAEIAQKEMAKEDARIKKLRDCLMNGILERISDVFLNGHPTKRLSNNLNCSIKHVEGESLLISLDLEGVAVSSGSACSAGSTKPSHVLTAIGLSSERMRGSLRLTLGRTTSQEEIDRAIEILSRVVKRLRSLSSL